MNNFIESVFIYLGIISCYECEGKSGEHAYRTKGGALLCKPCRNELLRGWETTSEYIADKL